MRNASLVLSFALFSFAICSSDVFAQSGSRGGSSSRAAAPRGSGSRGLPSAVVSRVGGARSKTIPSGGSTARPTGIMNNANAMVRSGQTGGSGGSSSRASAPRSQSYAGSSSRSSAPSSSSTASRSRRRSTSSSLVSASSSNSTTQFTSAPEGFRVWTDSTGRYSIQGKLAAEQNGTVWIRRTDGKLSKLTASQLSTTDQQFLASSTGT